MLNEFVIKMWEELELPSTPENIDGRYMIPFSDNVEVFVETLSNNNGYYLFSILGKIENSNLEQVYTDLMRANLFGEGTSDAALALEFDSKDVIIHQHLSSNIDYSEFGDSVEDFVNWVKFWRKEIQSSNKNDLSNYF